MKMTSPTTNNALVALTSFECLCVLWHFGLGSWCVAEALSLYNPWREARVDKGGEDVPLDGL